MRVHAVILAGGEGSRLGGVRKAELRIGNKRLIDRVSERLGGSASMVVATGPGSAVSLGVGTGVPDGSAEHGGPMAGIAAALMHLRGQMEAEDVFVTVAVDTPSLPEDYVSRLTAALESAPAAYAAWGDEIYPTNAAYRVASIPHATALPGSPKALLRGLGAVAVDWAAGSTASNAFASINRIGDLIALSRRALAAGE